MIVKLFRHGSIPEVGTFGTLHIAGKEFPSIEREWDNNERFTSCIPTGRYRLVPYSSNKYPDVYALVNEDLGIYLNEADIPNNAGKTRYAILIHIANVPSQLAGCIACGTKRGYLTIDSKMALGVSASAIATQSIFNFLNGSDDANYIDIENAPINW